MIFKKKQEKTYEELEKESEEEMERITQDLKNMTQEEYDNLSKYTPVSEVDCVLRFAEALKNKKAKGEIVEQMEDNVDE